MASARSGSSKRQPRPDLVQIAQQLKAADRLEIVEMDPLTWSIEAMNGEPDAIMAYLKLIQDGAQIILQSCSWPETPIFWAISYDGEQKTAIDQDWVPRPGDRIEADRPGVVEQYMHNGLPAFIPSARWLAMHVMCAIADLRFALERGVAMEVVHPASRLGWNLAQLFTLFHYSDWMDRSVRSYDGSLRGARATKADREIPLRDKVLEMARPMIERGLSATNIATRIRRQLKESEEAETKLPSERTIRQWVGNEKAGR